jgi:hypothetical protein
MSNSSLQVSDFFSSLTDDKPTKILFITFATLTSLIIPGFLYFIIWFEKYGSDSKPTMINKFSSYGIWCGIQYYLLLVTSDIFRFVVGPLPRNICLTLRIVKSAMFLQIFIYFDLIVISRYVYIFILKNPAGFNDEFWAFFLNICVIVLCLLGKAAYHLAVPHQFITFYFCCGSNPATENYVSPR